MYGLKEAARIAYDSHKEHLNHLSKNIWVHHTRLAKFCLCVDDFGVQHFTSDDILHILE